MTAIATPRSESEPRRPSETEVRACLGLLVGGKEFNASDRNRRFLTYIVDETLAGRADRIKAYNIALAAFDRTPDFDPLTDPIVRIEASRLRRALEHYYLTAGRENQIRIDIPKGSYVPTFDYRLADVAPESPPPAPVPLPVPQAPKVGRNLRIPMLAALGLGLALVSAILAWQYLHQPRPAARGDLLPIEVVQFENTGDPSLAFVARGFSYDVVKELTGYSDFAVYGRDLVTTSQAEGQVDYRYSLLGSVQAEPDRIHVTAILADPHTRQFVKAWTFERTTPMAGDPKTRAEIVDELVHAIRAYCIPFAAANSESAVAPAPQP